MFLLCKSARLIGVLGILCLLLMLAGQASLPILLLSRGRMIRRPGGNWSTYLPVVTHDYVPATGRLCRFGAGASSDIARYPVNQLRIGWYTDWGAALRPPRPGGIEYLQMVRLKSDRPGLLHFDTSR